MKSNNPDPYIMEQLNIKYPKTLLTLAFLEGGTVMCIELLGARFLAPTYGSSLEVWSIVLTVSIGALTLGYFAGGFFSLKKEKKSILQFILLLSGMLIAIMPLLARIIINDFNSNSLIFDCFIASLIFIAPQLFLLGSSTPIIIELCSNTKEDSGKTSGLVYGISTLGGIFYTYLTGFYLIPELGLSITSLIAAILLSLIPFVQFLQKKQYFVLAIIPVFLIYFSKNKQQQNNTNVTTLHYSEGLLGQLLLVDLKMNEFSTKKTERILFVNRIGQTWTDSNSGESRWFYPNYITTIASSLKSKPNVLVLGLGGGTVPRYLESALGANVDAVEIDKRMNDISKQFFSLSNTKVIIDDARHYIETCQKKYDLIVFDLYKGESPPSHTLSFETFCKTKKLLHKNGICIINFNGFLTGNEGIAGQSLLKTMKESGFTTNILPTPGPEFDRNCLYIGSLSENLVFKNPKLNLINQYPTLDIDSLLIDTSKIDLEDAFIITDDKPILEKLNSKASKKWREVYYQNFTKTLTKNNIQLFK